MKRILAIVLVLLMCISVFASCKNNGNQETTAPTGNETTEPAGNETTAPAGNETTEPAGNETTEPAGNETTEPAGNETTEPAGPVYDLEAAVEYLNSMYKKEYITTAADYQVAGQVLIGLDKYVVTWAVDSDKVNAVEGSPYWTIEVDEMSKEDVNYKIIATVTAPDGTTATVSYDRFVPTFVVTSFEDYMEATEGTVTVAGIVVGINAKSAGNTRNHLFLADVDGKGGYYCYQLDKDPLEAGIELGMTVAVTAPVSPYSGMQETKGGDFVIVDKTIKTVDVLDITEKFAAGESLKNYVGLVVTIKGVTIADQVLGGTSEYLNFTLNGKTAYVRTYVTDFPTTLKAEDKVTIDAAHAANFGNTADATGILVLYSGNPYLIPTSTDCFSNYTTVIKTDAEKVAAEKDAAKLATSFTADAVVELAAKGQYYDDVTLTWELVEENAAAAIADGKLTLTIPDAETIVKVKVTITCGEVTDSKTFEIKLSKTLTTLGDAAAIGAAKEHNTYTEEKYLIAGIISEIYNEAYGNMYIVDELGNKFTVYGTYSADGTNRFDAMESKPAVGDYVVILGALGQYNGTAQMKNGWIQSWITPTTIPAVKDTVKDFEKNQYTDNKVVITGTITEVQNTTYGNVMIADAEGNSILVYGLYNANGTVRYDAMTKAPAVGDTITVLGIVGKYNDAQMKNGWLVACTAGAGEEGGEGGEVTPPEGGEEGGETPPTTEEPTLDAQAPVAGTAYKFAFYQGNVKKVFYLTGVLSGYYMATTEDVAAAVDYYVEAVDGGYYFYCMVGEAKYYVNMVVSGTHINGKYEEAATTVYTYDETLKTLTANVDGTAYVFGTRDDRTYTTLGPMKADSGCFNGVLVIATASEGGEGSGEVTPPAGGEEGGETPEAKPNTLTIAEAIELGKTFEKDNYTTEKYYITGVVESVYNTTYGNIYLTDGVNTIIVYGLYSDDGTVRYDAMTAKPVAGDTITVYGVIGYYSSAQMKNGWVVEHTAHTCEYSDATCSVPATCTICKATTGTTLPHAEWNDATCTSPKTCKECGAKDGDPIAHSYVEGVCSVCGHKEGEVSAPQVLATFDFGANGSAAHVDGNDLGATASYDADGYTLALTGMSKVYGPAYDAKGNSCIKLGTSSKTGAFSFTVANDVNKVVIYVAKYKANTTNISVNGTSYTVSGASNDGAYDAIEIDTTTNKTVSFETVSGGVRCMVNTIEFWS